MNPERKAEENLVRTAAMRGAGSGRVVGRPVGTTSTETRRQILDAARMAFVDSGFVGTSFKEIATRAGLTPASITYHFGNKADLFLAVYADILDDTITRCQTAVRAESTMKGAITALLDTFDEAQSRPPDVMRFIALARTEAARHPEISGARDDSGWRVQFSEIAKMGVASGEISPECERAVRAMLAILVTGLAHHAAEAPHKTHSEGVRALRLAMAGEL